MIKELSGFVFHKQHMEFETLDSKTVKGIVKMILTEFKGKINVLKAGTCFTRSSRSSTSTKINNAPLA